MNFKYVKNREEYIEFINDVKDEFKCIEDWERFFGFNLKWNKETGETLETIFEYQGDIEYCPDSFPAVVYCLFEHQDDMRGDDLSVQIVDFVTFEELGLHIKD